MRASHETDRTQVPTRQNSLTHMDALEEKNTNMENDSVNLNDTSSSSTNLADKDLEKGEEATPAPQPPKKERDPNLIEFDGPNDPENPMNWSVKKKWVTTVALGFMTFCVTFASSVFSNATLDVAKLYNVSTEVSTLGTSLFVIGFAVGPL